MARNTRIFRIQEIVTSDKRLYLEGIKKRKLQFKSSNNKDIRENYNIRTMGGIDLSKK